MKKFNLTVIAAIVALLAFSMMLIEPTTTEASSNATPSATPRKRIKPSSINANVKITKPRVKGCCNDMDDWVRRPKQTQRRNKGKRVIKP